MKILSSLLLALITAFGTAAMSSAGTRIGVPYCISASNWIEMQMRQRLKDENRTFEDSVADLTDYQREQLQFYEAALKQMYAIEVPQLPDSHDFNAKMKEIHIKESGVQTGLLCFEHFGLGK